MIRTLRARIALWYGGIITICLFAYSATLAVSFAQHVEQELDRRVHEDIELAARAIVVDPNGVASWVGGFLGKQITEEEGGGHRVEVWDRAGRRQLTAGTFDPRVPGGPDTKRPGFARTIELPDGAVRVMTERVQVGGTELYLRAIVSEAGARAQVRALWLELAAISLTVLILGGVGGILLAHRMLGPLARMAERARRITA